MVFIALEWPNFFRHCWDIPPTCMLHRFQPKIAPTMLFEKNHMPAKYEVGFSSSYEEDTQTTNKVQAPTAKSAGWHIDFLVELINT